MRDRIVTFERSTALTAPDAIDTGTPLPGAAQTTFIICGWPINHQIEDENKEKYILIKNFMKH